MQPGEIYLDALFPLAVRRNPRFVLAPPEQHCSLLVLSVRATTSIRCAGTHIVEHGCAWFSADGPARFRSDGEHWAVVIGRRLADQLVISAFGEPGFSRFLDELTGTGSVSCTAQVGGTAEALCGRLSEELESRRPAYRTNARSILTSLLLALYRADLTAPVDERDGSYRLAGIIDYIETHYTEELSTAELARRMGVSSSHFSRLFSHEVGMPVSEYVNRARIRKACLLLRGTDRSVTEIAFAVGYNNISFFNRYFRRIMSSTPREYRRYVQR